MFFKIPSSYYNACTCINISNIEYMYVNLFYLFQKKYIYDVNKLNIIKIYKINKYRK